MSETPGIYKVGNVLHAAFPMKRGTYTPPKYALTPAASNVQLLPVGRCQRPGSDNADPPEQSDSLHPGVQTSFDFTE
ncbi:hypothetical protein D3C85_393550 [compost metagenome]